MQVALERSTTDAAQALQLCIDTLSELEKSLKLNEDKFTSLARKQDHVYPNVVVQGGREVREQKTRYGVQRDEMLRQIRHRIHQLKKAKKQPSALSLQHLSSVEASLAPHLHIIGYKWATAVFEFSIKGGPALSPIEENSDAKEWLQDGGVSQRRRQRISCDGQELRELSRAKGAPRPLAAQGGAGGSTEVRS